MLFLRKSSGFTLIELVVTVAILAIVATIAMPSMSYFIVKQRVSSDASELYGFLMLARAEATKRNAQISLIPRQDSSNGWSAGWCIGPSSINSCNDASVIRSYEASGKTQINSAYLSSSNRLTFRRDGTLLGGVSANSFKVSSDALKQSETDARCITINAVGQASLRAAQPNVQC
ncbi:GspH/FimT family pseudopilin [Pseudomonas sp.]|uniref:GspH/FimT family pseudopilin n=1 Tax=Pseudomonas sp. TaxID=306 RepID=UPI0028A7E867|nr:GspH/FimT family pseudopilin [Pseudomonas sp.]